MTQLASHGRNLSLDLDLSSMQDGSTTALEQAIRAIAKKFATDSTGSTTTPRPESAAVATDDAPLSFNLPKLIRFPYSRHSSYPELCAFVDAFKPKDVWPCTVDPNDWIRHGTH